jgi:hypothetical protein
MKSGMRSKLCLAAHPSLSDVCLGKGSNLEKKACSTEPRPLSRKPVTYFDAGMSR